MPSVNINELLWTAEKERLATCSASDLRKKAVVWLPWRSAPKAPTLLRHTLMAFVESQIAKARPLAASGEVGAGSCDTIEQGPTSSQPEFDAQNSIPRPLEADTPTAVVAAAVPETDYNVQHASASETRTEPANSALLENNAKEIAWLRRTLEQVVRKAQEMGVRLLQPGPTPVHLPSNRASATKTLVLFGLPLEAGASHQDASAAVHKFCSETLHLPSVVLPDIVRVAMCRAHTNGHRNQRPATVVVARMPAALALAIREAKRGLPSTCLVSIDEDCSRKERLRRQKLRQQRRQVGQEVGEEVPCHRGGAEGVEGVVAALH
jgi:hypothetical protein